MEKLQFLLSAVLMGIGLISVMISVIGIFRFRFVLNRMHCAAIIDSLGALCVLLSLILMPEAAGNRWKLLIILLVLWIGSPLASHLVARMELNTDTEAFAHMEAAEEEKNDSRYL